MLQLVKRAPRLWQKRLAADTVRAATRDWGHGTDRRRDEIEFSLLFYSSATAAIISTSKVVLKEAVGVDYCLQPNAALNEAWSE